MISFRLIVRRAVVTTVVAASLALGFASIQAAAAWTAASAPLAAPPVSADAIAAQLSTEQQRSSNLQSQLDAVGSQADQLAAALKTAGDQVASDAKSAAGLRQRLAAAEKRLASTNGSNQGSGTRSAAAGTPRVVQRVVTVSQSTGATPTPAPSYSDDGGTGNDH